MTDNDIRMATHRFSVVPVKLETVPDPDRETTEFSDIYMPKDWRWQSNNFFSPDFDRPPAKPVRETFWQRWRRRFRL